MSTFNFLTCKSIFHIFEHHKFEYFSQRWWDIQVCEKMKFMERWKRNGLYRNIRQSLPEDWYENWNLKIETYMKLKKVRLPCGQIYLNIYILEMIWNSDRGSFYIGIDFKFNTDMSCSAHVFSTGLITYFSDFFSYLLMSFCHLAFRMGFFPTASNN